MLADITAELGKGTLPPKGYNHARLFLIPKKDGGLIEFTRGICANNCDNRFVATAVTESIKPALRWLIHPDQKGFTDERIGTEHVHELTHDFYSRLSKKQQHHVLLLDMRRAFDTLAHSFMHMCLVVMGWADWLRKMVVGLLHEVVAIPELGTRTRHRVRVYKGVKQGCPLSPILFIICFDVLLCRLDRFKGRTKKFGFADDLALAMRSVTILLAVFRTVALFSKMSGLWMNKAKTVLVSTLPPSRGTRGRLDREGLGEVRFVSEAKYLGVLFGAKTSTKDVFADANDKFHKRLDTLAPVMRSSSLHDRILIVNVFLLPLFYYLGQFYVIPWPMVVAAKRACHRATVAFNGGGFGYAHLITPDKKHFGPHTPMKDLWAVNMTMLGSTFDLINSNGHPEVVMGVFQKVIEQPVMRK